MVHTYCWTWRNGSSSLVEDIILPVIMRVYASNCCRKWIGSKVRGFSLTLCVLLWYLEMLKFESEDTYLRTYVSWITGIRHGGDGYVRRLKLTIRLMDELSYLKPLE